MIYFMQAEEGFIARKKRQILTSNIFTADMDVLVPYLESNNHKQM